MLRVDGMDIDDELAEEVTDGLLGLAEDTSIEGCVEVIKQALQTSCNCFSEVKRTLTFLRDTYDREEMDPGWRVPRGRLGVALELAVRRCTLRWFFEAEQLHQDPSDQAIRDSAAKFASCRREAAQWLLDEEARSGLPRFGAKFLVFIHLFSGERRRGDIQQFLEKLTAPEGYFIHILSVDVIFDETAGDLANARNQRMWIRFARAGLIAGVFSGPPCESWSRARLRGGVAGFSLGDGGPRVIRTEEETSGLNTVKVKEARQLLLANRLLLFTISLFLVLLPQRKFMVMEHPSCPEEGHQLWMASVWKMYIIRCLVEHKDVQILTIFQGKFGGASPKPTTLMVLCGCDIDVNAHLDSYADVSVMPKALAMGWREDKKEYATASLKEYPVKLCHGLADLAGLWLQKRFGSSAHFSSGGDEEAMGEFVQYTKELAQGFNISAGRGADHHVPRHFN